MAEKTLTVDLALDMAVGMESARKNVTKLQTLAQNRQRYTKLLPRTVTVVETAVIFRIIADFDT